MAKFSRSKRHILQLMTIALLIVGAFVRQYTDPIAASGNMPRLLYTTFIDDKTVPVLEVLEENALWEANPDGSNKVQLIKDRYIVSFVPSPAGDKIAFISGDSPSYDPVLYPGYTHMSLNLLTVADGKIQLITPLTTAQTEPRDNDPVANETAAAIVYGKMAWSPDGQWLAFTGAPSGPKSGLFVYSVKQNTVKELHSGDFQVADLEWSPDSKYIVHFTTDDFNGRDERGDYITRGTWAVQPDGTGLVSLPVECCSTVKLVGWLDSSTFIVSRWDADFGWHDIRTINIATQKKVIWDPGSFETATLASDKGTLLVTCDKRIDNCVSLKSGLYLVTSRRFTYIGPADDVYWEVSKIVWSPQDQRFYVMESLDNSGIEVVTVSLDGKISKPINLLPAVMEQSNDDASWIWHVDIPTVSTDAHYWAWHDNQLSLYASQLSNPTPVMIAKDAGKVVWTH